MLDHKQKRRFWPGIIAACWCLLAETPLLAAPQDIVLPVAVSDTEAAVPMDYLWDDGWFLGSRNGYEYNHDLARVAGAIMVTTYQQPRGKLSDLLAVLGFFPEYIRDYHYADIEPEFPDKSAYSFAVKYLPQGDEEVPLVLVSVRGTSGQQEWLSNFNVADSTHKKERYHEGFDKSARMIIEDLQAYLQEFAIDTSAARILVIGHSRGAAVTNLVSSALDRGEVIPGLVPEHIYTYAFATPNSCSDIAERRAGLYLNIFNINNPEDVITELPFRGGSWDYSSYGHIFQLPSADKLKGKPERYQQLLADMSIPYIALTGGAKFEPPARSEFIARSFKNLQWAVGSVDHFYKRGDFLGHEAMTNAIRRRIPAENAAGYEDDDKWHEKASPKEFRSEYRRMAAAHDAATYNAWLLAGEPESIFMRGTPTVVHVTAEAVNGQKLNVHFLEAGIPFGLQAAVPGGAVVAEADSQGARHIEGELDPELLTVGGRTVRFIVPEGERLLMTITAGDTAIALCLTTRLEANAENGLSPEQPYISENRLILSPGEVRTFQINNRTIVSE